MWAPEHPAHAMKTMTTRREQHFIASKPPQHYPSASPACSTCNGPGMSRSAAAAGFAFGRDQIRALHSPNKTERDYRSRNSCAIQHERMSVTLSSLRLTMRRGRCRHRRADDRGVCVRP
jgi:hypothetical protein